MIGRILQPFISHKYLLYQLTQREIKARYKQSFVGYAWVLFNPLAQLLVFSFVFSLVFRFKTDIPYAIFLFSGLLPWILFQGSISTAIQSLVQNDTLIKKVAFPREIIPYSVVIAKIVDFVFSGLVFIFFMVAYQVPFSSQTWLFLPIFLIQILFTAGLSLIFSAGNLFYRDVQYLANLLLMLWMYMTPVIYPISMVPEQYLWLYKLNPMVGIIEGYRSTLFGYNFDFELMSWSIFTSLLIFLIGFALFKKLEKVFADVV